MHSSCICLCAGYLHEKLDYTYVEEFVINFNGMERVWKFTIDLTFPLERQIRFSHTITKVFKSFRFMFHFANCRPEDLHRIRVEHMERQLANLTGLVQKALVQNPQVSAVPTQQQYLGVAGQYRNG